MIRADTRRTGRMPHNWIKVSTNTPAPWSQVSGDPAAFHSEIAKVFRKKKYGARLENVYWNAGEPVAYVLAEVTDDPTKTKALARALSAIEVVQLLDQTEAESAFKL
jgi:hypothetical protein